MSLSAYEVQKEPAPHYSDDFLGSLRQGEDSPCGKFKGGWGGWGELFRMLPSVTIPPIILVPIAPILVGFWCTANELPYFDVMSDIGQNSTYFTTIIMGMTFLTSLCLLSPGFMRIYDDYTVYRSGHYKRRDDMEKLRDARWEMASVIALIIYLSINLWILNSSSISLGDPSDDKYLYADLAFFAWAMGLCFLLVILIRRLMSFSERWRFAKDTALRRFPPNAEQSAPRRIWTCCQRRRFAVREFLAYLAGRVAVMPVPSNQSTNETAPSASGRTSGRKKGAEPEAYDIGLMGIFNIAMIDLTALSFFTTIAFSAMSSIIDRDAGNSTAIFSTTIFAEVAFLFIQPWIPFSLLMMSKAWADNRSAKSATKAVVMTIFVLLLGFPRVPAIIDNLGRGLGFAGDRPVFLHLSPSVACSNPVLVAERPDCTSSTPVRSVAVRIGWMGPSRAIIHPGAKHDNGNTVVLDRKDVLSYEVVHMKKHDQ